MIPTRYSSIFKPGIEMCDFDDAEVQIAGRNFLIRSQGSRSQFLAYQFLVFSPSIEKVLFHS